MIDAKLGIFSADPDDEEIADVNIGDDESDEDEADEDDADEADEADEDDADDSKGLFYGDDDK